MKIYSVDEISNFECNVEYSVAIFCSGFESRARYIPEKYSIKCKKFICLAFSEHSDLESRKKNDDFFRSVNCDTILFDGGDYLGVYDHISNILFGIDDGESLLIDISCMTRAWVSSIVRACFDKNKTNKFQISFVYSPAKYEPVHGEYPPNEIVGPMPGFSSFVLPSKPISLIVGLGQDPGRATGLKEYIDPEEVVAFCPIPGIDVKYDADIECHNTEIYFSTRDDKLFKYPLLKPLESFKALESVVLGTKNNSAVVLCSLGPKIFNLYCLLISAHYEDVSVWRVTAGAKGPIKDCQANGEIVGLKVNFIDDDFFAVQ